ncbi:MAG: TrkH family potassium uptake protein, partial [Candidatus Eisenbacteria bacterium]|nr:TrkH family potassium uptake protein [Candidatus Latescibacterota bacterium]MBD3301168.1 TrkH family potassium uptake protein [Candidatus Eisenbacteria bacterium]
MLLPLPFSLYYGGGDHNAFLISAGITIVVGFIAFRSTKLSGEVRAREGFAIVTLGWVSFSLFGCLPFLISGQIPSFTDAFFETMSGFTTTGATILPDIERLPHGILFWRSFTHWLGGMGIIVLSLAILPFLGVGGMQLFKAEVPGPVPDKLKPRVTETAKILWGVYMGISGIETLLLLIGGMDLFEALCHTFGTMATGGFSTKNASIGHYDSAYIEYVITFFMLAAGTSFALHYRALRGEVRAYLRSHEFRLFLGLLAGATLLIGGGLFLHHEGALEPAFRMAVFQVASILTTTGYGTADFERWSVTAQMILFGFMFIGGCAGSTGGGMKVARLLVLVNFGRVEVKRLLHPRGVIPIRIGETVVPRDVAMNILGFLVLMLLLFFAGVLAFSLLGYDWITSFGAIAATLGNIGPGFGMVGPTDNYAHVPILGKWM